MSKKILHTFVALAAALILTGGFSMTAYAGGGEEYEVTEPTPEPKPEETAEPSDPLTPEGNATLVDDIWGENKQLITVTTKNGNYFYILIDRAAEGENTVHFLNMVDEADLMALIEDGEKEETTVMPQTCTCKEKCEAGAVNESCPVCLNNRNSCTGTEKEAEPETEAEPEKPKNDKGTKSLLLLFLLTLFAGGGAFYYFKYIKPKDTAKGSPDFSDFDFDEDEESDYEDDTDLDGYGDDTEDTEDTETDEETDYGDDTETEETGLDDDTEGGV